MLKYRKGKERERWKGRGGGDRFSVGKTEVAMRMSESLINTPRREIMFKSRLYNCLYPFQENIYTK